MSSVSYCRYQSIEFSLIESDKSDKRETKNSEGSQVGVLLLSVYLKEKVKCLSYVVLGASTIVREAYLSIGLISIKKIGDDSGDQLIIPGGFILVCEPLVDFTCFIAII